MLTSGSSNFNHKFINSLQISIKKIDKLAVFWGCPLNLYICPLVYRSSIRSSTEILSIKYRLQKFEVS